VANPIVRNAQEQRQLALIGDYLDSRGYRKQAHPPGKSLTQMEPGTYAFRMNLAVGKALKVNIPVDVVIQPERCIGVGPWQLSDIGARNSESSPEPGL